MPHQLVFAHAESDLKDPYAAGIVQELHIPLYRAALSALAHVPEPSGLLHAPEHRLIGSGSRACNPPQRSARADLAVAQPRASRLRHEPNFTPDESSDSDQPIKLLVCSTAICRAKFVAWFDVARSRLACAWRVYYHMLYVHLHLNLNSCTSISPRCPRLPAPHQSRPRSRRWPSRSERAPPVW